MRGVINGAKIKSLRTERGITFPEFSDAVRLSAGNLHDIESGLKQTSVAGLTRIADYFEVPVDSLIHKD